MSAQITNIRIATLVPFCTNIMALDVDCIRLVFLLFGLIISDVDVHRIYLLINTTMMAAINLKYSQIIFDDLASSNAGLFRIAEPVKYK